MSSSELGEFFDYIWRDTEAWVYLPLKHPDQTFEKAFFKWPRQRRAVVDYTLRQAAGQSEVFYSPALFQKTTARKEGVLGSHVLWLDFDGNAPQGGWPVDTAPEPTLVVQSSLPGHQHCYWLLDEFVTDIEVLEDRNRALAIALNADTSGWDADQILRPPFTMNRKRGIETQIARWDRT